MTTTYTFSEDIISDLHKDAYGFRPSQTFWYNWSTMTDDQKQATWDSLVETMEFRERRRQEEQDQAIRALEDRIAGLLECGARNRAMAIRWLDDAYETGGDLAFLEYNLGVPYGYLSKDLK